MSWLYSRALVEEYLADTCLDGAQSALWSGTPTPQASWLPAKMTEPYRLSRSGMTFKHLTGDLGEGVLMSFLEAFPARIFQRQEAQIEKDWRGSEVDYGPRCLGSFARWNPRASSWKTAQLLLSGGLEQYSANWPRWGMMQNGECFQLETLEHDTSVREFGSSPIIGTPLKQQRSRSERFRSPALNPFELCPKGFLPCPEWVEKLMGWPIGWTGLRPLETGKFQQWLKQHSIF